MGPYITRGRGGRPMAEVQAPAIARAASSNLVRSLRLTAKGKTGGPARAASSIGPLLGELGMDLSDGMGAPRRIAAPMESRPLSGHLPSR